MSRRTFVVVAGGWDTAARSFVERYADHGMRLMTPRDLSQPGWRYCVGEAEGWTAMIGGHSFSARDVAGVLTRLPCVTECDLPHIASADRAYVAAEMTAFLLSWLTDLERPQLNRPTPQCLSGPCWPHEKWVRTAARIGISTTPARRRIRYLHEPDGVTVPERASAAVTIVGKRYIGSVDRTLRDAARALAEAAGANLLVVRFDSPEPGARFANASPWVDLGDRETAEAVMQCLRSMRN